MWPVEFFGLFGWEEPGEVWEGCSLSQIEKPEGPPEVQQTSKGPADLCPALSSQPPRGQAWGSDPPLRCCSRLEHNSRRTAALGLNQSRRPFVGLSKQGLSATALKKGQRHRTGLEPGLAQLYHIAVLDKLPTSILRRSEINYQELLRDETTGRGSESSVPSPATGCFGLF